MSLRTRLLVGVLGLAMAAGGVGTSFAQTSTTPAAAPKTESSAPAKAHVAGHRLHARLHHGVTSKHVAARHGGKRHLVKRTAGTAHVAKRHAARQHVAKRGLTPRHV